VDNSASAQDAAAAGVLELEEPPDPELLFEELLLEEPSEELLLLELSFELDEELESPLLSPGVTLLAALLRLSVR
jgi:hypothetical protein